MNFQRQQSNLLKNKILIIILSVALITCISVLVIFFISNKNNNSEKKSENSETISTVSETQNSNEKSEQNSTSSQSNNTSSNSDVINLTQDYGVWNADCSPELVLVNANNKLPDSYSIQEADYCGVKINSIISVPLNKMIEDARTQKGLNLWLSSTYRDIATQERLYQEEVKTKLSQGYPQEKAEILAAQEVARPGYSEHNTGLAVDFNGVMNNFKETGEYKWLLENSYKYGFVLRYPEEKKNLTGIVFEPWHFRFVGVEVATEMKQKNICFEEYVSSKI